MTVGYGESMVVRWAKVKGPQRGHGGRFHAWTASGLPFCPYVDGQESNRFARERMPFKACRACKRALGVA